MPSPDEIDMSEAMMEIWRLVKPSEAKDLKIIVGSSDGRFAGIFTCDADQHGDRFFVLKEKPRSKTWTLASNLMSHFDDLDAAGLSKAARQSVNEFRAIFANPAVKYEPGIDLCDSSDEPLPTAAETRPEPKRPEQQLPMTSTRLNPSASSSSSPDSRLSGKQLIARAKELEGRRPEELAKLCGYVLIEDGQETGDVEGYYAALFEAHSN